MAEPVDCMKYFNHPRIKSCRVSTLSSSMNHSLAIGNTNAPSSFKSLKKSHNLNQRKAPFSGFNSPFSYESLPYLSLNKCTEYQIYHKNLENCWELFHCFSVLSMKPLRDRGPIVSCNLTKCNFWRRFHWRLRATHSKRLSKRKIV